MILYRPRETTHPERGKARMSSQQRSYVVSADSLMRYIEGVRQSGRALPIAFIDQVLEAVGAVYRAIDENQAMIPASKEVGYQFFVQVILPELKELLKMQKLEVLEQFESRLSVYRLEAVSAPSTETMEIADIEAVLQQARAARSQ